MTVVAGLTKAIDFSYTEVANKRRRKDPMTKAKIDAIESNRPGGGRLAELRAREAESGP
jgi:hypothetical protein